MYTEYGLRRTYIITTGRTTIARACAQARRHRYSTHGKGPRKAVCRRRARPPRVYNNGITRERCSAAERREKCTCEIRGKNYWLGQLCAREDRIWAIILFVKKNKRTCGGKV